MNKDSNSGYNVVDLGVFTMLAPQGWSIFTEDFFGQRKKKISLPDGDKLEYDYGADAKGVEAFAEIEIVDIQITEIQVEEGGECIEVPSESYRTSQIIKSAVHHENVNGLEAEIIIPETDNRGSIGISFSKIGVAKFNFYLYGILKPHNQIDFLKAVKTLKLKG